MVPGLLVWAPCSHRSVHSHRFNVTPCVCCFITLVSLCLPFVFYHTSTKECFIQAGFRLKPMWRPDETVTPRFSTTTSHFGSGECSYFALDNSLFNFAWLPFKVLTDIYCSNVLKIEFVRFSSFGLDIVVTHRE